MANALYLKGVDAFAKGQINWVNDDIRILAIDTADYTVDITNHEFLSSIPTAAREEVKALTSKTVTGGGICDAADPTFVGAAGDPVEALIVYKHTGTDSTSHLIYYIDTAPNLPVILNGSDVIVEISSSGLFRL